eukprot:scaffold32848_cov26-Prasinocladus_malaysianus.AAC.1
MGWNELGLGPPTTTLNFTTAPLPTMPGLLRTELRLSGPASGPSDYEYENYVPATVTWPSDMWYGTQGAAKDPDGVRLAVYITSGDLLDAQDRFAKVVTDPESEDEYEYGAEGLKMSRAASESYPSQAAAARKCETVHNAVTLQ